MTNNRYVKDEFLASGFFKYKLATNFDHTQEKSIAKFFNNKVPESTDEITKGLKNQGEARKLYFEEFQKTKQRLENWIQQNMENPAKHLKTLSQFYDRFTNTDQTFYSPAYAKTYFRLYQIGIPSLEFFATLLENNDLDLDKRKSEVENLLESIMVCGPGTYNNITDGCTALAATLSDDLRWQEKRKAFIQQAVNESIYELNIAFTEKNGNTDQTLIKKDLEIHYVIRVTNDLAAHFNLEVKDDLYAYYNGVVEPTILKDVMKLATKKITKVFVAEKILDNLLDEVQSAIQQSAESRNTNELEAALNAHGPEKSTVFAKQIILIHDDESNNMHLAYDAKETIFLSLFNRLAKKSFFDTSKAINVMVDKTPFTFYPNMSLRFSNGSVEILGEKKVEYAIPITSAIITEFTKSIFPYNNAKQSELELHQSNLAQWIQSNFSTSQKKELLTAINKYLLSYQFTEDYEPNVDEARTNLVNLAKSIGIDNYKAAKNYEGILLEMLIEAENNNEDNSYDPEFLIMWSIGLGYAKLLKYIDNKHPNILHKIKFSRKPSDTTHVVETALTFALNTSHMNEELIKYLVEKNITIHSSNSMGQTPLDIVHQKNLTHIGHLIVNSENFNPQSPETLRVLSQSIRVNEPLAVVLLDAGIKFDNQVDNIYMLENAIRDNQPKILKSILEINSKEKFITASSPKSSKLIIKAILDTNDIPVLHALLNGPNIDGVDPSITFKKLLQLYGNKEVTQSVKRDLIKYAIKNNFALTALQLLNIFNENTSSFSRQTSRVIYLMTQLKYDERIKSQSKMNDAYLNILLLAAKNNDVDIIKLLFSESKFVFTGPDILKAAEKSISSISLNTFTQIIKHLDLNNFATLLLAAYKNNRVDLIDHLIAAGADLKFTAENRPFILIAIRDLPISTLQLIIKNAGDITTELNTMDSLGNTAIIYALENPDISVFMFLLNQPSFDLTTIDYIKLLRAAAIKDSGIIMKALIERKPKLSELDELEFALLADKYVPQLKEAVLSKRYELVNLLLTHNKEKITTQNEAYLEAIKLMDETMLIAFLKAGANYNIQITSTISNTKAHLIERLVQHNFLTALNVIFTHANKSNKYNLGVENKLINFSLNGMGDALLECSLKTNNPDLLKLAFRSGDQYKLPLYANFGLQSFVDRALESNPDYFKKLLSKNRIFVDVIIDKTNILSELINNNQLELLQIILKDRTYLLTPNYTAAIKLAIEKNNDSAVKMFLDSIHDKAFYDLSLIVTVSNHIKSLEILINHPNFKANAKYLQSSIDHLVKTGKYQAALMILAKSRPHENLLMYAVEKNDPEFLKYLNLHNPEQFYMQNIADAIEVSAAKKPTILPNLLVQHEFVDIAKPPFENLLKNALSIDNPRSREILTAFSEHHSLSDIIIDKKSLAHIAVEANNAFALQLLCENNATMNFSSDLYTPLELAIKNGNKELVNIILDNPHSAKFVFKHTLTTAALHDNETFARLVKNSNYNQQIETTVGTMHLIQFIIENERFDALKVLFDDMNARSNPYNIDLSTITAFANGPRGSLVDFVCKFHDKKDDSQDKQQLLHLFIDKYIIDLEHVLDTEEPVIEGKIDELYSQLEELLVAYKDYFKEDKLLAARVFTLLVEIKQTAEAKHFILDNVTDLELNPSQKKTWKEFCESEDQEKYKLIAEVRQKSSDLYPLDFIKAQFENMKVINRTTKSNFIDLCKLHIPKIKSLDELNQLEVVLRSKSLSNTKAVGFFRKIVKADNDSLKTLVRLINKERAALVLNLEIAQTSTNNSRNRS